MNRLINKVSTYSAEKLQNYFDTAPLKQIHEMKLYTDDKYYNTGEPSGFTDWQYDMLKSVLNERDPNYVPPVGAKIRMGENRVELPYWLGSMDKIMVDMAFSYFRKEMKSDVKEELGQNASFLKVYNRLEELWNALSKSELQKYENMATLEFQKEIATWMSTNPSNEYIIESKLDGVSCLLIVENRKVKLYTRGDGIVGADISYLAPYFSTIPKNIKHDIAVRGELIMKESTFKKKYSNDYANPRNMVAGRLGGKTVREGLKDIEFIAYEIVGDGEMDKPSDQLETLYDLGFTVVKHETIDKITVIGLTETLVRFKEESPYEIDGIIVQTNIPYERNTSGNPDYAFAFKIRLGSNLAEATVKEVEWNVSKWGVLKPRIRIDPISLNGVTITYATGFNAKYINDHNIGPGAIIHITRSGDVIPFIVDVLVEADEPQMPEDIEYQWNSTGVDIFTEEQEELMCVKLAASFFAKLGIKHVSQATVLKMYNHGLESILQMISATQEDLEQVEGFGKRSAERIYENIHNGLQDVSIPLVLGASGVFGYGMGRKRIEALFESIPDLLDTYQTMTDQELKENVMKVEGFSDKSADKILENIEWADQFIQELTPYAKFKTKVVTSSTLEGMKIVFSGFRDKGMTEEIISKGGKVSESVSKLTTAVVIPVKTTKYTGKPKKAHDLGINIYTKQEFIEQFLS